MDVRIHIFASLTHFIAQFCCLDRKSTRLNSSHQIISYAVFCLKKKKQQLLSHRKALSVMLACRNERMPVEVQLCVVLVKVRGLSSDELLRRRECFSHPVLSSAQ